MTKNTILKQLTLLAVCLFMGLSSSAQVKVGNNPTTINANSVLEMESTNKGMLLPRLGLSSTSSFAPLAAHVAGMTVYNTATAGDVTPGFYYNDGSKWVRIASLSGATPLNTTAGPLMTVTNGTGATFTAMGVAVDTTALKAFISSAIQNGAITGKNTTAGSLITVTNGAGATLTAMTVAVDTNALKTMLNNAGYDNTADHWLNNGTTTYTTTGNVAINTSSASEKLTVSGAGLFYNPAATAYNERGTYVDYNTTTGTGQITAGSDGGNFRNLMLRANNGTAPNNAQIFLHYAGNVGIGNTAPTNQLHVNATSNPLRLEGLQAGAATDSIMTVDATGVVRKRSANDVSAAANNNWRITGNAATTPPTAIGTAVGANNYWGTTDAKNLAVATNGITRAIFDQNGSLYGGTGTYNVANTPNNTLVWGRDNSAASSANASAVFGVNNVDSSAMALVAGTNNKLTPQAYMSSAIGDGNTINSSYNFVVGWENKIEAFTQGGINFVSGDHNVLKNTDPAFSQYSSIVGGGSNNLDNSAYTIVAGAGHKLYKASNSAVFGSTNTDSAGTNLVTGTRNIIRPNASNSITGGSDNTVNGPFNFTIGNNNTVGLDAGDVRNIVTGYLNTVGGTNNTANNIIFGYNNLLHSNASHAESNIMGGQNNIAANTYSSAIFGDNHRDSSNYTLVAGVGNTISPAMPYATVVGKYNTPVANSLFLIGNGTSSSATSNVMTALQNGNVGIGTTAPATKLHVVSTSGGYTGFELQDGTQGVGKILTSDANGAAAWSGNAPIAPILASNGNAQLIDTVKDVWHDLDFKYVLPVAGTYLLTGKIGIRNYTAGKIHMQFGFKDSASGANTPIDIASVLDTAKFEYIQYSTIYVATGPKTLIMRAYNTTGASSWATNDRKGIYISPTGQYWIKTYGYDWTIPANQRTCITNVSFDECQSKGGYSANSYAIRLR